MNHCFIVTPVEIRAASRSFRSPKQPASSRFQRVSPSSSLTSTLKYLLYGFLLAPSHPFSSSLGLTRFERTVSDGVGKAATSCPKRHVNSYTIRRRGRRAGKFTTSLRALIVITHTHQPKPKIFLKRWCFYIWDWWRGWRQDREFENNDGRDGKREKERECITEWII